MFIHEIVNKQSTQLILKKWSELVRIEQITSETILFLLFILITKLVNADSSIHEISRLKAPLDASLIKKNICLLVIFFQHSCKIVRNLINGFFGIRRELHCVVLNTNILIL